MEFRELNKKEMGARIRARREALNMSRSELGKLLSVTGKFIADIEYGDKGVSLKNLYRLKQVLGVSADYILEGDETYISAYLLMRKRRGSVRTSWVRSVYARYSSSTAWSR